ncbi:methyltransferase domain-containing protein [Nocardioides sp. dk4132]|uniref:class I SAM-dependent methyltransferase n=1 Tax=unclassified Nocardioides TaxID=2615069 RepID=UPI0012963154|nr:MULTISPECIES: class I SAM-dependent methyltransferase [unclassified Nocardioides]MQW76730.1 methyltransferase domain-containing protein [Nocardioides sp. dk4132]QGA06913.1 methyltransferase domain-containing protein [Nocardioides sp. dk884]
MSERDPMVDEFDTVAAWTADAVEALGPDHALPAACRGSGSPAALDWLADAMGVDAGTRLLDSGAGVGGPTAYLARTRGTRPVLAEPMVGACRAAGRLFGSPVVVADGARLPFGADTFDAAWSLGVLCTLEDKRSYLRELARVVRSGGAVGLLVYTRAVDQLPDQPEGNWFPSRAELVADLDACALSVLEEAPLDDLPGTPEDWQRAADAVEVEVERVHGEDPRWVRADEQQRTIASLIEDGLVVGLLVSCRHEGRGAEARTA